jgi:hypothetical protein
MIHNRWWIAPAPRNASGSMTEKNGIPHPEEQGMM